MTFKHDLPSEDGLPPEILRDVVQVFKALSDSTRAQLVYLLTFREYSVNELSENVAASVSAVSHHLSKLRAIRLVKTRRDGKHIYYSIDDSHVGGLFKEALYHLEHVHREGSLYHEK